jgi:hypothetical protein
LIEYYTGDFFVEKCDGLGVWNFADLDSNSATVPSKPGLFGPGYIFFHPDEWEIMQSKNIVIAKVTLTISAEGVPFNVTKQ